jgi:hypothetical protein
LAAPSFTRVRGVAVLVVVSRFFCFPIQMNFAENQKWPSSRVWRGRATDGVGGLMRRAGLRRSRSTELSCGTSSSLYHISETHTRDLLYRLAGPEMASLAIGSRCASPPTKPVAQASRRTGDAWGQWQAPPATAAGWVLWATGLWQVLPQSSRGQPRAADTAMVDAAR